MLHEQFRYVNNCSEDAQFICFSTLVKEIISGHGA
jgi:hypothetical protein